MSIAEGNLIILDPQTTIINAGRSAGKREIRGAIRYRPSDLLEADHLALPIDHHQRVILYAEGGQDETLARISEKMRADGFTDVRVYEGTLAYEQAGGATQDPSLEQAVPPSEPDEA